MADTPSIPPLSVALPAASGAVSSAAVTPVAPVTPPAPAQQQTLADIVVIQAPPPSAETTAAVNTSVPVNGQVISSSPQAQQIVIQTALGKIIVQSPVLLPPDTPVLVQLSGQNTATVTVLPPQAPATETTQAAATLPPPLQEGQSVTALLLPESRPALTLEQIVRALEPLKAMDMKEIKAPQILKEIFAAPDIRKFLEKTPPQRIRELTDFLVKTGKIKAPDSPSFLPPAPLVSDDESLIHILQKIVPQKIQTPLPSPPQTAAEDAASPSPRAAPPSPQPLKTAAPSVAETLKVILASGENMKAEPHHDFPAEKIPLIRNMYQISVLKILPPMMPPPEIKKILQTISESVKQTPPEKNTAFSLPPALPQLAEVETETSGQQPILKTADGSHFVIRTPVRIPVGTVLVVTTVPMTPEEVAEDMKLSSPQKTSGMSAATGPSWPALEETLQSLQQLAPPLAQTIRQTLPSPTARLAPTALFFLAALRLGSIDQWLGETALQTLEGAGKKDLADRLTGDFKKISAQSKEILKDDWHAISMPLLHDDHVSQMQFYVRHPHDHDGGNKDGKQNKDTRFILNLQLSRMGEMQLDGFIRKKQFDIILRTEEKLPFDMRQEIMKRFVKGLGQVHMEGGISFQTRREGWVLPEAGHQGTSV